jgi:thiamine biosynthesis protein ThiS
VITLQVNGKQVELDAATPLLSYLSRLQVDPRSVAVEHNGEIVERSRFEEVVLDDGDQVEIVRMVGGGSPSARTAPF